jgi:DNA-binding NtrC family response regulator
MIRIQIVDDEPNILKSLARLLRSDEWELECSSDPHEALEALKYNEYGLIISDFQMPGLDGLTYLRFARQRQPDALRMVLTGQADCTSMMKAINQAEVHRFLVKPWDECELLVAVRSALSIYRMRKDNQRLIEKVRYQQLIMNAQGQELRRLETEHPGLIHVSRDSDGVIHL